MGSESPNHIPFIDFCSDPGALEPGSKGWNHLCREVRAACERYGCFEVAYDGVPVQLRDDMFEAMKRLFDLPLETKQKNYSSKIYRGYIGQSDVVPLYESLGVEDAPSLDAVRAFTDLMWPEGNPWFCDTVKSMSEKMWELEHMVRKMLFDSYGAGEHYESHVESSSSLFRVMKYRTPEQGEESAMGLLAHTDKNMITVLCPNQVEGLQVQSKEEGDWIHLTPRADSFIVIIGDTLKAWSNGRLHPVRHRVVMSGVKERFSCGLFSIPNEEMTIEVPPELVDKDHPLLFRPFKYMDYVSFAHSENGMNTENALEIYAGV
ncbi:hypothetical protein MRB53_011960 [Persea americana]|uniref:Uncharacterized protein n=1 Tax=Persea americana TaxID=3435 RepID=A0ACC2LWU6_PERAE|nr:hypothetical protein MRB53_011960 [Persea americana]